MSEMCPVCSSEVSDPVQVHLPALGTHGYSYSCRRCGNYYVESFTHTLLKGLLDNDQKAAVLSHWIRTKFESISRTQLGNGEIILTADLVQDIIKRSPPSCAEQADKLILWLGDNSHPAESVSVDASIHQSIIGAITPKGFHFVLDALADAGLVTPITAGAPPSRALTYKGWEYYDELRRGTVDSRKAFMAMKYGEEQLDKLVESVLKPAVRQTGFDLFRLVERPKAGLIDDRLRAEIQTSRFLIADLTHENAGAYWEAGYAEGMGKPVIYTCEKKKFDSSKTHFDTNHHLTILWDSEDPENVTRELKATIRATLPAEAKLTDD